MANIREIKESDWKYLRKLKPILLERACAKINRDAQKLLENKDNIDQYQLYLTLYKYYKEEDEVIAECFNDHRRSMAKFRIISLVKHGIMTDDELQGFSDETRETVAHFKDRE